MRYNPLKLRKSFSNLPVQIDNWPQLNVTTLGFEKKKVKVAVVGFY